MIAFLKSTVGQFLLLLAIVFILLIADSYSDARLAESAYKNGYADAMTKVAQNNQAQSEHLTGSLETIFNKHTQTILDSLRQDKEQRDEISKLLQTGVYINGNCHESNGISLLNEQITSRYNKQREAAKSSR